jgi:hypothetical protein
MMDFNWRRIMQPESRAEVGRREWRKPSLQKLPIAATANSSKPVMNTGNDGAGGGKGDVHGVIS